MRVFELTDEEEKKFNEWRKSKGEVYAGAAGGAYEFCFTPTGLGMIVVIKCLDGTELDLTDSDNW